MIGQQRRRRPARVVLAGVHGFGATYLTRLARLAAEGVVEVSGLCDPRPPEGPDAPSDVPWAATLPELFDRVSADVVIVAAPIGAHAELTRTAFLAGADVLLEKPPTPTLAEFDELAALAVRCGRRCQVGFQSFGCQGIDHIRDVVAGGELGAVRGIGVFGAWVRPRRYWTRSPWAGRRQLHGRPVVDGVVTNPLAHAVATALRIDGSDRRGDLMRVHTELFRANAIEADDTSCVRILTRRGTTITAALTLCAGENHEPYVRVHGTRGSATLWYKTGRVEIVTPSGTRTESFAHTDLLADLVEHRGDPGTPLISELPRSGAFAEVMEAVRLSGDPVPIGGEHVSVTGVGADEHVVVDGVDALAARAADSLRTYAELGAAWARPLTRTVAAPDHDDDVPTSHTGVHDTRPGR